MKQETFNKYICCSVDLTTAARLIAFIGISISVLLVTVLMNDKLVNDYDASRNLALAFGLDWKHIHPHADTSHRADPEGKMITILLVAYAVAFFIINICLLFASISFDERFAVPWLLCELLGSVSKFGALIFHLILEFDDLSNLFIAGSIIYIVIMTWCWLVIFAAHSMWLHKGNPLKMADAEESSRKILEESFVLLQSPKRYVPNPNYATI